MPSIGRTERQRQLQILRDAAVDPVRFTREVLHDHPWSVQEEILRSVATNTQTAVKACNASGKTRIAAAAALWWITRFSDGIVVTTAPTYEQVQKQLWGEIHQAIRRSKPFKWPAPSLTELKLKPNNYATGLSTNQGINFQGFHSNHLLFVIDEAPGVEADIWEAIEGARAGGQVHILALGNPTITGGPFHAAFTSERNLWTTFSIDAFDTPNLAGFTLEDLRQLPSGLTESDPLFRYRPLPFLVTRRWVYEKYWTWGEKSPLWQARVRGQFAEQAEDALLSLAWLEAARVPKLLPHDDAQLYAGIDVAEAGDDETVCVIRTASGRLVAMHGWHGNSRGPVIAFLNQFKDRLEEINFDRAGVGAYFADDFEHLGFRSVTGINVGEASRFPDRFRNLKAELYWALRERFQVGQVSGLTDELAVSQLASIRYLLNPRGLIEIESKDEMRKRGVKSPDRAEALMLAFANLEPGIFDYQRHLAQQATGTADPADPYWDDVEAGAQELHDAYWGAGAEDVCPKCHLRVKGVGIDSTDGRRYHPDCLGVKPQLMAPRTCANARCRKPIVGASVEVQGAHYHAACAP